MKTFCTEARNLITIPDLGKDEIEQIIKDAFIYRSQGMVHEQILSGHVVTLIFEKPSLRTRIAFEAAVGSLGGIPIFQSGVEIFQRSDGATRETIEDIANVLERYSSCIIARVNNHNSVKKMADCASIPVINALCDQHHPTQAIADLMTIMWHKLDKKKLKVAFIGDGNNVGASLMHICTMMGYDFVHAGPKDFWYTEEQIRPAQGYANTEGSKLIFTENADEAVSDADVVYTDTFVSMGDEGEGEKRLNIFAPCQVTSDLMKKAKSDAIFLHCLPAHRGEEVTNEVIDSPQSKVFDLAECRMHVAKALLKFYLS